jgi:hypothetical protein
MKWMSAAVVKDPKPGKRVPATVENSAAAHIACPPPYGNIDESAGDGSRSIRLTSPVNAAHVSPSSLCKVRLSDAVSPTRISSNVLFSIISFMRTAPRECRKPDPRQAIDGCLRTAEGEADAGLLLQATPAAAVSGRDRVRKAIGRADCAQGRPRPGDG